VSYALRTGAMVGTACGMTTSLDNKYVVVDGAKCVGSGGLSGRHSLRFGLPDLYQTFW
jgi:hypothetical protein